MSARGQRALHMEVVVALVKVSEMPLQATFSPFLRGFSGPFTPASQARLQSWPQPVCCQGGKRLEVRVLSSCVHCHLERGLEWLVLRGHWAADGNWSSHLDFLKALLRVAWHVLRNTPPLLQ